MFAWGAVKRCVLPSGDLIRTRNGSVSLKLCGQLVSNGITCEQKVLHSTDARIKVMLQWIVSVMKKRKLCAWTWAKCAHILKHDKLWLWFCKTEYTNNNEMYTQWGKEGTAHSLVSDLEVLAKSSRSLSNLYRCQWKFWCGCRTETWNYTLNAWYGCLSALECGICVLNFWLLHFQMQIPHLKKKTLFLWRQGMHALGDSTTNC